MYVLHGRGCPATCECPFRAVEQDYPSEWWQKRAPESHAAAHAVAENDIAAQQGSPVRQQTYRGEWVRRRREELKVETHQLQNRK